MSYRLIDANAIATAHPKVNDMPCIYADLPDGLDWRLYDLREIGELQDENARLRSCLSDDAENARQIMAENDRLRKLCFELYKKYRHVEGVFFIDLDMDELEERLRKLGIETRETWE